MPRYHQSAPITAYHKREHLDVTCPFPSSRPPSPRSNEEDFHFFSCLFLLPSQFGMAMIRRESRSSLCLLGEEEGEHLNYSGRSRIAFDSRRTPRTFLECSIMPLACWYSSSRDAFLRETPSCCPFSPTTAATRGYTSQSSMVGIILSLLSPPSLAKAATSLAAAMTIVSVIVLARMSSAPRSTDGKMMLLFT